MKKVISFCIYGNKDKYCGGMLDNLELIKKEFPNFETWIYCGNDVPIEYIEKYKTYKTFLIFPVEQGAKLMANRIFPIDNENVEIVFGRDADSRINERDIFCIKEFINSDKKFHIIRDNYWHKQMRICGGTFGIKKGAVNFKIEEEYGKYNNEGLYGSDEKFLQEYIYTSIKNTLLVHSDIIHFTDEEYPKEIKIKNTGYNFVGNVYENSTYTFNYWDQLKSNIIEHYLWLRDQKAWIMTTNIFKMFDIKSFESTIRYTILDSLYIAYYYLNNIEECKNILKLFKYCHVDDHIINNSNFIISKLRDVGMKVIGTTNINRIPKDGEVVIIYGNYHHCVDNLPHSNLVKRHAIYHNQVVHDEFEAHECWDEIDQIYILNLKERVDRYMEMMFELCRIGAPLDKIHHYMAEKEVIVGDKTVDPHIGALKNHIDVIKHFINGKYKNCLILEDDVTFTSEISLHQNDMMEFFKRKYDFDVCLITSSKYWDIKDHDDLLCISNQICTTSSGYILNKDTCEKVLNVMLDGYNKMIQTKDTTTYAVDRYWHKIHKDNKFYLFNTKFGYQRCNYSSITGNTSCHFD